MSPHPAGETVIFAITEDGGKTARCDVSVLEALSGHGYVDLGLSVRWAACNVGADSPEEYGDYMGLIYGAENVHKLKIRDTGAMHLDLESEE